MPSLRGPKRPPPYREGRRRWNCCVGDATARLQHIHEVAGEAVGLEGELVADDAALGVVRGGEGVDARVPATVVLLVAGAALAVGGVVHGTVLLHVSS